MTLTMAVITSKFSMSSNVSEWHAGGMPPSEHADWVLDLGPGGGVNGGRIVVVEGTPEQVAAEPKSFTGQYLAPLLARSSPAELRDGSVRGTEQRARDGAQSSPPKKTRKRASSSEDQPDLIGAK